MTKDRIAKRNAEIRALAEKGVHQTLIAQRYDLSESQVYRIVTNRSGVTQ